MNILVTGGAGFIGSHVVELLNADGHNVIVLDNLSTGKKINLDEKIKFYEMDLQDEGVEDVIKNEMIDAVCHLAAATNVRTSVEKPLKDIETNVCGLVNLLEACRAHGVKHFVFSSTGGALYGNTDVLPTPETHPTKPISPYGIDKLAGEQYLYYYSTVHGLPVTILRYSNVYGPRQDRKGEGGVVAVFIRGLANGEEITINGSGDQTRDFIYVEDIARANVLAIKRNLDSIFEVYNISGGKETSVNALYKQIAELCASDARPVHGPELKGEIQGSCLDHSKAKSEIGFSPEVDLEEGIAETIEYFKDEGVITN